MAEIDSTVRNAIATLLELQEQWHAEDQGSAWASRSDLGYVTGGSVTDPTGNRTVAGRRTGIRDRIGAAIIRADGALAAEARCHRARLPGPTCANPECDLPSTHGPRCWDCHTYRRRNGYDAPADLVADWAARRRTECECPIVCCPDGCLDWVPAGDGRISPRCRQRMHRAREAA